MYQGLTFGLMVVVAVGTAIYYFIQGSGQEEPQSSQGRSRPRYERPSPPPAQTKSRTVLQERRRKRNLQNKEELEQDNCIICTESLYNEFSIRLLTCGHEFHNKCIAKWLDSKNITCPLCREPVRE